MIAASQPVQRPADARLLVVDARGRMADKRRSEFVRGLRRGDLVIANDAATLPASLHGRHVPTGAEIEVRLAGRRSLSPDDVAGFSAIVFGPGDYHTPTESRPLPPPLAAGDGLVLGSLEATVHDLLGHSRLISLRFTGSPDAIWRGIAQHGRPIQYAHVSAPLALWDVWTAIAGRPVAFEPPSAGFVIDWETVRELRRRRIGFATITHAAGISSTGDDELDRLLPFDEPYEIPRATALAIRDTRAEGRRIVAIGTTVVRALEQAASANGVVRPGPGVATQRIDAATALRVVDVILSGVHERSTSHYRLLRAFQDDDVLTRADALMRRLGYRTHEFGDSVLIERRRCEAGVTVSGAPGPDGRAGVPGPMAPPVVPLTVAGRDSCLDVRCAPPFQAARRTPGRVRSGLSD